MNTLSRYIRAFIRALQMTFRGEKPQQHPLVNWTKQMGILTDEVLKVADQNGLNKNERQSMKLKLDGRQMSVETILTTLKFHATQEYPNLLQYGFNSDILNTIYATNINDQYWISQIIATNLIANPVIQAALVQLKTHLDQIPPMSSPS